MVGEKLELNFFERDVESVARALIGTTLLFDDVGGSIVEVEAYHPSDPAAHTYRGPTPRNAVMFGPPAHAYVYRSYGLHWCLNFVCGGGAGILIRALEPRFGLEIMGQRRGALKPLLLCSGPGRLTQALAIDGSFNGTPLNRYPFQLYKGPDDLAIVACPRIGISVAKETPWRFCLAGSKFLSRPATDLICTT